MAADDSRARLVTIWRSVAAAQPWAPCIVLASVEGSGASGGAGGGRGEAVVGSPSVTTGTATASFGTVGANVDALSERLSSVFQWGGDSSGQRSAFQRGVGLAVLCEPGGAEATALLAAMVSGCPWIPMDVNDVESRRTMVGFRRATNATAAAATVTNTVTPVAIAITTAATTTAAATTTTTTTTTRPPTPSSTTQM